MKKYVSVHYYNLILAQKSQFFERFSHFSVFLQGIKVRFWHYSCSIIRRNKLISAEWRIFLLWNCWSHLFHRNRRYRGVFSRFLPIFEKKSKKRVFWPPYDVITIKFSQKSIFRNLQVQTKNLRYWKLYFEDKKIWTPLDRIWRHKWPQKGPKVKGFEFMTPGVGFGVVLGF